jgi:hypothetical protein
MGLFLWFIFKVGDMAISFLRKEAFLNRDVEAPRLRSLHPTCFFSIDMHCTDLAGLRQIRSG